MPPAPRTPVPPPGRGAPTPPIDLPDGPISDRIGGPHVEVADDVMRRLSDACAAVFTDERHLAEAGRDWWPLAMGWALDGQVGHRPAVVASATSVDEVSSVLAICDQAGIPVTTAAGRSGVLGGSVPVFGGVVLDVCGLDSTLEVDHRSLLADVSAGVFGDVLEHRLRTEHDVTLGHWPQSMALSTVGGWLACRSAGQLSNRYGKIEDMVVGLTAVLPDGRVVRTGGAPRAAVGPDLTQLFVGSEGTLGVICDARLRLAPAPQAEARAAWSYPSFSAGLAACRRVIQRGATPAALRLYDAFESNRHFGELGISGDRHVLLVLDEGDPTLLDATMAVVDEECGAAEGAERHDERLVEHWVERRNDVAALEELVRRGYVVDTMEIAAPWGALDAIYDTATAAIGNVEGALVASAHQSHAYRDGACLYFTFAGQPPPERKDAFYRECWETGTRAVLAGGGALSHHHGVGLNRGRFMAGALGSGFDVLVALKHALDPNGILNPGKLGLPSPFGEAPWP